MNKKENNQPFILSFVVILIVITARYLIFKLRPGTFSIITFQIINTKELIVLGALALLIITDKLKYYWANSAICLALIVAYLTSFFIHIKTKDLGDYIGAGLALLFLGLLMQYSIRKLKNHKENIRI